MRYFCYLSLYLVIVSFSSRDESDPDFFAGWLFIMGFDG
jgi:hypothetical protein